MQASGSILIFKKSALLDRGDENREGKGIDLHIMFHEKSLLFETQERSLHMLGKNKHPFGKKRLSKNRIQRK